MAASRGQYRITNKLAKRQCLGIGGEAYVFEVGEVRTLNFFPWEAKRFEVGGVFTVVEIEAGEDPSDDFIQRMANEASSSRCRKRRLGLI